MSDGARNPGVVRRPLTRVGGCSHERIEDDVAVERALEIRVDGRALSVTLRSPGDDVDLVTGFLASEGVAARGADIASVDFRAAERDDEADVADVRLAEGVVLDWSRLERNFATSSACGLCGRARLEALRTGLVPVTGAGFSSAGLLGLSARVRGAQSAFDRTGGVHAAVWCDAALEPRIAREDVGRHNAVDKVAGALLRAGRRPVGQGVLWVSGRAGAELVLKSIRAGIPALAAVGAPTSLAIELAQAGAMTLIGFLREGRMNVYVGESRVTKD